MMLRGTGEHYRHVIKACASASRVGIGVGRGTVAIVSWGYSAHGVGGNIFTDELERKLSTRVYRSWLSRSYLGAHHFFSCRRAPKYAPRVSGFQQNSTDGGGSKTVLKIV